MQCRDQVIATFMTRKGSGVRVPHGPPIDVGREEHGQNSTPSRRTRTGPKRPRTRSTSPPHPSGRRPAAPDGGRTRRRQRRTGTAASRSGRGGRRDPQEANGETPDGASETAASPLAIPWRGPSPHAVRLTSAGRTAGLDDGTGPAEGERRGVVGGSGALAVGGVHEPVLSPARGTGTPGSLTGSRHVGEPCGHGGASPRLRSGLDGNPDGELAALLVEQVGLAEPVTARGSRTAGAPAHRHPRRLRRPTGPADAGMGDRHDPSVPCRCSAVADGRCHEKGPGTPTTRARRRSNREGGTIPATPGVRGESRARRPGLPRS